MESNVPYDFSIYAHPNIEQILVVFEDQKSTPAIKIKFKYQCVVNTAKLFENSYPGYEKAEAFPFSYRRSGA